MLSAINYAQNYAGIIGKALVSVDIEAIVCVLCFSEQLSSELGQRQWVLA